MKLAAYNIWESPAGMPHRFSQITDEITACGADVFCLQEVENRAVCGKLAEACGYASIQYSERDGTAVFSRIPFENVREHDFAVSVTVCEKERRIQVFSIHLPWKSALSRERAIVNLVRRAAETEADCTVFAGDFNGSEHSSVHRFLTGDQSLLEADAYFFDLAEAYAAATGTIPAATLNVRENPRWGVIDAPNTIQTNQRFDRIYLQNPYPREFPVLKACALFGTAVSPVTRLAASDHYGISAVLEF